MSEQPITDAEINAALDRIARTPDGVLLYRHLQKRLMAVRREATESALNQDNGERIHASELMARMAAGIDAGTSDGGSTANRPIVFAAAKPVAVASAIGARRRFLGTESDAG